MAQLRKLLLKQTETSTMTIFLFLIQCILIITHCADDISRLIADSQQVVIPCNYSQESHAMPLPRPIRPASPSDSEEVSPFRLLPPGIHSASPTSSTGDSDSSLPPGAQRIPLNEDHFSPEFFRYLRSFLEDGRGKQMSISSFVEAELSKKDKDDLLNRRIVCRDVVCWSIASMLQAVESMQQIEIKSNYSQKTSNKSLSDVAKLEIVNATNEWNSRAMTQSIHCDPRKEWWG